MTERIPESMAGTWLEYHWRWKNNYLVVEKAQEWGFQITEQEARLLAVYQLGTDLEGVREFLLQERGEDAWPSDTALLRAAGVLMGEAVAAVLGSNGLTNRALAHLDSVAPEGMAFEWGGGLYLKCRCQIRGTVENDILYEDDKRRCDRCAEREGL